MPEASTPSRPARDWLFPAIALQLGVAMLLGGTARPLNVLLCVTASLPTLYMLLSGARRQPLGWFALAAVILFALGWLQLVPLPPEVWTSLPGRALAAQVLTVAELPLGWRPLALDPAAAAASLLAALPAILILLGAARLTPEEILRLLKAIAVLAILTATLGIFQRATGQGTLYDPAHAGYATGLFANRNHHAAFLASVIALLPLIARSDRRVGHPAMLAGVAVILYAGVLATTSRAGIALGTGALVIAAALHLRRPVFVLAAGVVSAVVLFAAMQVPALDQTFERFTLLGEDQRFVMAETTWTAAQSFLPWGSGWGSFVPVYMAFEDLDTMDGNYVVNAHNDYLQLMLEGGLVGLLVALSPVAALVAIAMRNLSVRGSAAGWEFWVVAAILLLHSAVDYPLRTSALAAVFALAFAAQEITRKALPAHREAD